jgi:hypothetical protein
VSEGLVRLEAVVAHAMVQPDPAAALAAAALDEQLPAELRDALKAADPDGVRIAALIVVRLRFERTLNGSLLAGEWFERDGAAFTEAFKRYHTEVPPTASLPSSEGRLFEGWLERQGERP